MSNQTKQIRSSHVAQTTLPDTQQNTLLCIETSGTMCSIALAETTLTVPHPVIPPQISILAELSFSEPYQHDRLLAEGVRILLESTHRTAASIGAVAVSAGPGSFTGLRIGASFAKAFTFDDGFAATNSTARLLPVPTMNAIAHNALQASQILDKKCICVAIPSHKDLVYVQDFILQIGDCITALPVSNINLVQETTIAPNADTFYVGPYFSSKSEFLQLPAFNRLNARMIAEYSPFLIAENLFLPSEEFIPLYAQEFIPKIA